MTRPRRKHHHNPRHYLARQAHDAPAARHSFTLVELMLVIAIMFVIMGMVGSMVGLAPIQNSQVRLAAEQLAAVLRQTRQLAMDHNSIYGVTFNITNAPGSTGQVLNNRSGGHWYRIVGPHDLGVSFSGYGDYRMPYFISTNMPWAPGPPPNPAGYTQIGSYLQTWQSDMYGPKYVLPPKQVRFISLTDEDNGNNCHPLSTFAPTYPRPWFGNFVKRASDPSPRLYAWGGYDSGFKDSDGIGGERSSTSRNPSGFYFQGAGAAVVGCLNPADTKYINDSRGSQAILQPTFNTVTALPQGESRPLVNGDWLDCLILFMPDGSCLRHDWMQLRHAYGALDYGGTPPAYYFNLTPSNTIQLLGPGDMCNGLNMGYQNGSGIPFNYFCEASDYDNVTGMYYITLGPDAASDTVKFQTADKALASMMPMYRVGISRLGEVKIFKVTNTMPAGTILDPKWKIGTWTTASVGTNGYYNQLALSASGQKLVPAQTFVTPAMMSNMQWWIDPSP